MTNNPMNDQKKIIRPTALFFFPALSAALSIIIACASSITTDEIWEGIHDNTLRVFVTIDRVSDFTESGAKDSVHETILLAGRNRAGALLLSYARAHVTDRRHIDACLQSIPEIINRESMRFMKCSDEICTAVFDFNIERFLDAAGRHDPGR